MGLQPGLQTLLSGCTAGASGSKIPQKWHISRKDHEIRGRGASWSLHRSLPHPFGCSQLCLLLIGSLLRESRETKEKSPGTGMGDSGLGFFSPVILLFIK